MKIGNIILASYAIALISCGSNVPPVEGFITACKGMDSVCTGAGSEKGACGYAAPSGYYWEALPPEKINQGYRCPFELRKFYSTSETSVTPDQTVPQQSGCNSDSECKGNRICVDRRCQNAEAPAGQTCSKDIDCPGETICVNGECGPAE